MSARSYGKPEFLIGGRAVGPGHPCYVIAEAGANHNRDHATALSLIEVAAEAGADAVKFQTYTAEGLYSRRTPDICYLKEKGLVADRKSVWDLIKRVEIPWQWHATSPGMPRRAVSRSSRRRSRRPLLTCSKRLESPHTRSPRMR